MGPDERDPTHQVATVWTLRSQGPVNLGLKAVDFRPYLLVESRLLPPPSLVRSGPGLQTGRGCLEGHWRLGPGFKFRPCHFLAM